MGNNKEDPLKLLDIIDEESSKAWLCVSRKAKIKKLFGEILCKLGFHDWSDKKMPVPIHCMRCTLPLEDYLNN